MSEGETTPAVRPRKPKLKKILLIVFLVTFSGIAALAAYFRYKFPYGATHACSVGLGIELRIFAEEDHHWFPHGEATPEASLGLLYTNDLERASHMLGSKTISHKVVAATLKRCGKISPATCGWHYVEGLRDDDDGETAIAWDKAVGLGHNGQRWKGGMHEVVLLDGTRLFVSKSNWPEFAAKQKKLIAQAIASRGTIAPPIRWSDEETLGPNRFSPK